jgi:hypothetical protein
MSAPSVETLLKMIADYFCGKPNDFVIYEKVGVHAKTGKDFYEGMVYKKETGKKLDKYVVRRIKGRYRLELIAA